MDSSIFLYFSASAIRSGSDERYLEGLTSDLAKKQEFRGEHILAGAVKVAKIKCQGSDSF